MTTERAGQTSPAPPSRVLIVAGCYADAAPALALVDHLVRGTDALLLGVLAQDPRAAAAIGAPVLSAVARASGRPASDTALTGAALQAAYAADARAFGARLAQVAHAARLRWELRNEAGPSVDIALRSRAPGDVVVLGHSRMLRVRGPLVVLEGEGDNEGFSDGLALAERLGRAMRLRVHRHGTLDDPALSVDLLERISATAIVAPPALLARPDALRALIEAARCPVLIWSASD